MAQNIGLPKAQNGAAQLRFRLPLLFGGQAFSRAPVEQRRDIHFPHHGALAANLGGVGGQDRADDRAIEKPPHLVRADASVPQPRETIGEGAAFRRAARDFAAPHGPNAILILSDIGEMREIAEAASHLHRMIGVKLIQGRL